MPTTLTRALALALLVPIATLATRSTRAQDQGRAAAITEPGRKLDRALDIALANAEAAAAGERTLLVIVDPTKSLQAAGFASAFASALTRNAATLARTRIAVLRTGADKPALAPTDDRAAAATAVQQLLASPDATIQNVYADLRTAATLLGPRPGKRDVLLASLDNGDAEDDLEGTVARLTRASIRVHVLTTEAYLADSYWAARGHARAPRGCKLQGGDAPLIDLPWGWLFQMSVANEVAPSGFASYGLNRVAAASGGKVFLFTPPDATAHRCSVYGGCLFCLGDHVAENETFWNAPLEVLAPPTKARTAAAAALGQDPWFRATARAWREAHRAGLLSSTPPNAGGTESSGGAGRGEELRLLSFSNNLEHNADRADAGAKECARILAELDADLARIDANQGSARQRAIARFTRLMLQLTRVNLVTFAGWCREVAPAWLDDATPAPAPPEIDPLPRADRAGGLGYTNYCLCHGVRPFLGVELPGARLREELERLATMEQEFLGQYAHTPFTIAWHRQSVARFHLTFPGTLTTIERERSKSKAPPDPTTGGDRPARGGTTGTGGTTGPATGGGR